MPEAENDHFGLLTHTWAKIRQLVELSCLAEPSIIVGSHFLVVMPHLSQIALLSSLGAQLDISMRFLLLDRICSFVPDTRLTAIKNVSLAEDYLADHFPEFPVLPGVFMIEAATQAAAWLIRLSENYAHSTIVLHEMRAVKFADFVSPGHTLQIHMEQKKRDAVHAHMRFQGDVDGRNCVSGRLVLECTNLAGDPASSRDADLIELDKRLIDHFRTQEAMLTTGSHVAPIHKQSVPK